MRKILKMIRENSLSIALFTLFAIFLSAQSFAGWHTLNQDLSLHGRTSVGYWHYVSTGTFWDGLASNWQAAVLQLGSLIVFSSFLYQRGAPHSLDPRKPRKTPKRRKETWYFRWIYRNSLSMAFLLLFLLSFTLHVFSGASAYNAQRLLTGQASISTMTFLLSARFWSSTLQTWQAEYLVISLYVVLTIFLRQEYSPESKPTEASHEETGEANK